MSAPPSNGSGSACSIKSKTLPRPAGEDVFLLSGELAAVRSASIVTPRGERLQIRWMAEDGSDVKEGERVMPRRRASTPRVPRELRAAVDWAKFQALYGENKATLEKAKLEQQAFLTSSRSDLEVLRRTEEKARRELEVAEKALLGTSIRAPRRASRAANEEC